jgi:putative transposase
LKYRSKKAPSESISLCARNVKRRANNEIEAYERFKIGRIKTKEDLPAEFKHDLRLQRNALGEFYLLVPVPSPPKPESREEPSKRIIALDPGTRTFMTGYEPSGSVIEVGGADMGRIERLCAHLDALQSRIATVRQAKKKWRMRGAAARMRRKIRNLVDDVHKKVAHFLATNYDLVVLPKFEASAMVKRASRRIHAKAVRAMLTWAHYRFRQRILHRCKRANCSVAVVTEEYTSMTCGNCGELHVKLGRDKRFLCPTCAHHVDRDRNAARNILLKNGDKFDFLVERHL